MAVEGWILCEAERRELCIGAECMPLRTGHHIFLCAVFEVVGNEVMAYLDSGYILGYRMLIVS